MDEFFDACDLMLYSFWTTPVGSLLQRRYGMNMLHAQKFIESGKLELITDIVLVCNMGFIIFESAYDLQDIPEPGWIAPMELFFSVIYMAEVAVQLATYSFRYYW